MMKRILMIILLSFCCFLLTAQAKPIDGETAARVAANFAAELHQSKHDALQTNGAVQMLGTSENIFGSAGIASTGTPSYYIFALNPGWCVVSGDDNAKPVLAYSVENNFSISGIPENAKYWFDLYNKEISSVASADTARVSACSDEWVRYISGDNPGGKIQAVVEPLIQTHWNQDDPYNLACPSYGGNKSYTGCVATAMAQIMKYWNYPVQGTGYKSYTTKTHGTELSSDFAIHTYKWDQMIDDYENNSATATQKIAVAQLMYDCGVALSMNYDTCGSGAYSDSISQALKEYFAYDPGCEWKFRIRDYYNDDAGWISMLKNELNNKRPMEYSGNPEDYSSGHSFVCDGYDNADYFHFNFGWGGSCDEFYSILNIVPETGGIGAGERNYSYLQAATIGIKKPDSVSAVLAVSDSFALSNSPYVNGKIMLKVNFTNIGTETFTGDVYFRLYTTADDEGYVHYVKDLGSMSVDSMPAGFHFSQCQNFASDDLFGVKPGDYTVLVFYKYNQVAEPTRCRAYNNEERFSYLPVHISGCSYGSELEYYAEPSVTPRYVYRGRNLIYNVPAVKNISDELFSGTLYAIAFQEGEDGFTLLDSIPNVEIRAGWYQYLNRAFSINTSNLPEGDYYIMTYCHNFLNDSARYLNSGDYTAAVPFTVIEPPVEPDRFEPNNSYETAYNFSDNNGHFDATIHTGDEDYYRIPLDSAKTYKISIRAYDGYNDKDNYTCDVAFDVTYDNVPYWDYGHDSEYDTTITNSGSIILRVKPYYDDGTGSYRMEITTEEVSLVQPDEYEPNNTWETAYVIPYNEVINIDATIHEINSDSSDEDYYRINLDKNKKYKFDFSFLDRYSDVGDYSAAADWEIYINNTLCYYSFWYEQQLPDSIISNADYIVIYVKNRVSEGDYVSPFGSYNIGIKLKELNSLSADKYEPNNTFEESAVIAASGSLITIEANINEASDVDYYKINFPKSANYQITAQCLCNNAVQTANVQYRFFIDGEWSQYYYASDAPEFTFENGGPLYVNVKPKNSDNTGTYKLYVVYTVKSGVEEVSSSPFSLITDEASQTAQIVSPDGKIPEKIILYDVTGHAVDLSSGADNSMIDISGLAAGKYFVEIYFQKKKYLLNFVKSW